ncbi:MAG: hypothetical protein WBA23_08760 [Tunicatimonas sp.]|uniref:hypothetical protein n=1 Tax=Tunicatimonas sp. TaxID=1940096 RepID=UPI003C784F9B
MVIILLKLHLRQLGRSLRALGIIRSIFVLALLFFTLTRIHTATPPITYVVTALVFLSLASLHTFRKDKVFLQLLDVQPRLLYLIEYHLLASPLYVLFLLNFRWLEVASLLVAVTLIPFINMNLTAQAGQIRSLSFVPAPAFEWKSNLRKQRIWIGLLYISALVLYAYPFVTLLVIVIFTFVVTTFYNEAEPRSMVEVFADISPRTFLWQKGKAHLLVFWVGCLPLVLIFLVVNTEYWYVLVIWFFVSSIIQLLSIMLKYSFYQPGHTLNNNVFMFIYFLSLFVPFFVPVPLVMLINYYRRAKNNLRPYLDD